MTYLILVRHSISWQQPGISSHTWPLTDEGRARCVGLAAQLARYAPAAIVSSPEPKALQTAQLLAEHLHIDLDTEAGLHEHLRTGAAYLGHAEFQATISRLLSQPGELVFGEETGDQAADRFSAAVEAVQARYTGQSVVIVTHATVMSLYLARVSQIDPVAFWRSLGMPAYVVLDMPGYHVREVEREVR